MGRRERGIKRNEKGLDLTQLKTWLDLNESIVNSAPIFARGGGMSKRKREKEGERKNI